MQRRDFWTIAAIWRGLVMTVPLLASCTCPEARSAANADREPSIVRLRSRAERGDAKAQFDLGDTYAQGRGIPRDDVQAGRWLRKAAGQGNADAANDLGVLYETGRGVTRDPVQAAAWYRQAANNGLAIAQNNLGRFYAAGAGLTQDFAAAKTWFDKAAAQGNPEAMNNLARIYGEGDGVHQDSVEGLAWSYRAQARYQALGLKEPDYGVLNRQGAERELTPAQIAEARRRSGVRPANESQALRPVWASDGDMAMLARIGIDPARDLEARENYHWRWRAHADLVIGGYRCPAGTAVDLSRTLNLASASPAAPCHDTAGGRFTSIKLLPDGSTEVIR
jgi:hypothetical protein